MTEADVRRYIKTQLGVSWVDVEAETKDLNEIIAQTLLKLAPYYDGKRYVQATGKIIDLSAHHPLAISNVYNIDEPNIMTLEEYAFGGTGVVLFDASFVQRFISYNVYKMLWNELQYQKGMNYKFINETLYLDGYYPGVVIEMLVTPRVVSDVDDRSMWASWVKEYALALTKELLGRVRGKFNVAGSPYELDSAQLLQEAATEKASLESQLIGEIYIV